MISYVVVAEHGQIIECGQVQDEVIDLIKPPMGATLIRGVSISDPSMHVWDGQQAQPLPPRPSFLHEFDYPSKTWKMSAGAVRTKRDKLLAECDWTQLPDVPLETKDAWAAYRQALRDLTDQGGFPDGVIWPVEPD